jgi:hypothetical protein
MARNPSSRGGSANISGVQFEATVAAWFAAQILAERAVANRFEIGWSGKFDRIWFQADAAIDDIVVGTSDGHFLLCNVKSSQNLTISHAAFGSAAEQFVRFQLGFTTGSEPWDVAAREGKHRMVLVVPRDAIDEVLLDLSKRLPVSPTVGVKSVDSLELGPYKARLVKALTKAWKEEAGKEPSGVQLLEMLQHIAILPLDIGNGGADLSNALGWIEGAIVDKDTTKAWPALEKECLTWAKIGGGADILILHKRLKAAGILLIPPSSIAADLDLIRNHNQSLLNYLKPLSRIARSSGSIELKRPVTGALEKAADKNSLLVIGDSGSGKSGVLHWLADQKVKRGADCVLIAVDDIDDGIQAAVGGISRPLIDILRQWDGPEPGFLIIDALDAARFGPLQKEVRRLIQEVLDSDSRWRVVASIRKFDLRHGHAIQQLFAGKIDSEFRDSSFHGIRHINVSPLTDDEIQQLEVSAPDVSRAIDEVGDQLRQLVRNPFHLRLFVELLSGGTLTSELRSIGTQTGLLDRYWSFRVENGEYRLEKQKCLEVITSNMVQGRAFRASEVTLANDLIPLKAGLQECLSSHVLSNFDPAQGGQSANWLMYSHHMLFDFACTRLYVEQRTIPAFTDELSKQADLVLFLRPSISMHYSRMWDAPGRKDFWDWALKVVDNKDLPGIVRIIGPTVFSERAVTVEDFSPLLEAIYDARKSQQARRFLRYTLGVYFSNTEATAKRIAPIWTSVARKTTEHSDFDFDLATGISPFLNHVARSGYADTVLEDLCLAGAKVLSTALHHQPRLGAVITQAVSVVARAFAGAPDAAEAAMRPMLSRAHIEKYGHEDLFWITNQISEISRARPSFATEIYAAAFGNDADSDDMIPMGDSQILPLRQSKRDAYRHNWWALSEKFSTFFEASPTEATKSMFAVVEARNRRHKEKYTYKVELPGREVSIIEDHSSVWFRPKDEDDRSGDSDVSILDKWVKGLVDLGERNDESSIREIEEFLLQDEQYSAMFAGYLRAAATNPGAFVLGFALIMHPRIMISNDLGYDAVEYFRAAHACGNEGLRKILEAIVLNFSVPGLEEDRVEYARKRLLGVLNRENVVTDAVRSLLDAVKEEALPRNYPRFRSTVTSRTVTQRDHLERAGVDVDADRNRLLIDQFEVVMELYKSTEKAASEEEKANFLAKVKVLFDAIHGEGPSAESEVVRSAYGMAATSAVKMSEWYDGGAPEFTFLMNVLLEAADQADPEVSDADNERFERSPSWGWPTSRIEAADGLVTLLDKADEASAKKILPVVWRLLGDGSATVRYHIVQNLVRLYSSKNDLMWKMLDHIQEAETNLAVLDVILVGALGRMPARDIRRVVSGCRAIIARIGEGERADDVREHAYQILLNVYLWLGDEEALGCLKNVFDDIANNVHAAGALVYPLREMQTFDKDAAVRERSIKMYREIALPVIKLAKEVIASDTGEVELSEDEIAAKRSIIQLADRIATEIYFATGAYNERDNAVSAPTELQKAWFQQNYDLLEGLLDLSLPSLTHHLIETLEHFIPAFPSKVFDLLVLAITAGARRGYQFEQMGAEACVRIIETFLASHRDIFAGSPGAQENLIKILDIFIDAGWPEARRLAFRLSDIYS